MRVRYASCNAFSVAIQQWAPHTWSHDPNPPIPIETEVTADEAIAVEYRTSLAADEFIPVEWLATAGAPIDIDTGMPVEWLCSWQADEQMPVEALLTVAADEAIPAEWLCLRSADATVPAEYLLSANADGTAPVEWRAGIFGDAAIPVDWLSILRADHQTPSEWLMLVNQLIAVSQSHGFNDATFPPSAASDAAYELGTRFNVSIAGQITALRFYRASGGPLSVTGRLWNTGGTQLASATYSVSGTGWQEAAITPVDVTPGNDYVVSYNVGAGESYAYEPHYFDTAKTSGYITGVEGDGATPNGVFNTTPGAYPSTQFNATLYFADVVLTQADTSHSAIPVEWMRGAASDHSLTTEWLASLTADEFIPTEWRGALIVDIDGKMPVEWRSGVAADGREPFDWSSFLAADATLPMGWLRSLQADAAPIDEWRASRNADATLPADWRLTVNADEQIPADILSSLLTTIAGDGSLPIEWRTSITADATPQYEWTAFAITAGWLQASLGIIPSLDGAIAFALAMAAVAEMRLALDGEPSVIPTIGGTLSVALSVDGENNTHE